MQDRKTFRRFLDLYGHHRAHSRKLSLHNFPTWAFYDFGTIVWVLYGTTRPLSHVWAHKGPGWVLTVPYGSALKAIVYGSCGLRTSSVCCLEILRSPTQAVTIDYGWFAYRCSQARKSSTRARTVPSRSQRTHIDSRMGPIWEDKAFEPSMGSQRPRMGSHGAVWLCS